ncbi:ABC transporter family substrate-binding protein [Diaminobutyricimonas sp. LJ205]|uniref:ABC transporter family substrate-binding protein n=1 Tax=Diaminobutyricimonas sp. LJ205 TaxID=2683590 RepID=UPI001E4A5B11|nr:ABC transporter family substrate-binding protein [Diaminobutyricimonas sp. LJ205]
MRIKRIAAGIATVGVGALILSGCSTPEAESGLDEGTSVTAAWNQAFYSYNSNTSFGNATANQIIISQTMSSFGYYDNTPKFVQDESFGTYELVSEDPQQVKYTLADTATWSDGTKVDAADLLLNWASQSNAFNDADFDPSEFLDPETGEVTEDFPEDQVYFDGGGTGLDLVTEVPEVGDDGKSVTLSYDEPFVDWEIVFGTAGQILPAHVVAKYALEIEDAEEGKQAIIDAIEGDDQAALAKISNAWNTIFNFTEMPDDTDLVLSTGPYMITEFVADQFVTLKANPEYKGDKQPKVEEITVRVIPDPLAAVTALENGEVDIISPQATTDVVKALEPIDDIEILTGLEGTYEHVDLQFDQSKSGHFDDPKIREAFLKTIPRQQILDTLIKPIIGDDATLRDSQIFVPGAEGYDESVANNGSAAYAEVDIEGAKALLAEAGVTSPEVCILYASNNPRRVNEFSLIQASAGQAGFNVTDCGAEAWGGLLGTPGAYDASLFGWQSTGLGVTEPRANYVPDGLNNLNYYNNDEVTALLDELNTEFDAKKQIELLQEVDKHLWADAYGVTIFQFPSVTAYSSSLVGVDPSILSPTIFWNTWEWERSE